VEWAALEKPQQIISKTTKNHWRESASIKRSSHNPHCSINVHAKQTYCTYFVCNHAL